MYPCVERAVALSASDAVDYVQDGTVYRYTRAGVFVDSFRVGITPGAFCFKYSD